MSFVNKVADRMRRAIDEPWMWLGSDKPQVIAGGQSHRMALVHALRSGLVDLPVAVLTSQPGHDRPTDSSYWAKVAAQPRDIPLALLWVGNEMNANFLLEQEPPVRTADATDAEGKRVVPTEMFRAFVFQKLERLDPVLVQLSPRQVVLVGPPPPKSDAAVRDRLAHEPFLMFIMRSHGVAPDDAPITPFGFRLKLWHMHRSVFSEVAERHGVAVLPIPAAVVDDDGALRDEFAGSDASHANDRYGALVWRLIAEHFGVTERS